MQKNTEKRQDRKERMGFVTNRMSDEVYNQLNSKAQKNQLSKYINELVKRDLNGWKSNGNEEIGNKITELEKKMNSIEQMLIQMAENLKNGAANENTTVNENPAQTNGQYAVMWGLFEKQLQKNFEFFHKQHRMFIFALNNWVNSWFSYAPVQENPPSSGKI
ncbi:MAG: hypothetical protein LOD92_03835 [Bacillales bacterium]